MKNKLQIIAAFCLLALAHPTIVRAADLLPTDNHGNFYIVQSFLGDGKTISSHGTIVHMNQHADGSLESAGVTNLPPNKYAASMNYNKLRHRLYVAFRSSTKLNGPVAQYNIGPDGTLSPANPLYLKGIRSAYVRVSPNGRYLLSSTGKLGTIESFEFTKESELKHLSTWRDSAVVPNSEDVTLEAFRVDPTFSYLYAAETHDGMDQNCCVLEFKIGSSAKLIPIGKTTPVDNYSPRLVMDYPKHLAYICSQIGYFTTYAIGGNGQLDFLGKQPDPDLSLFTEKAPTAADEENPLPESFSMQVNNVVADDANSLLIGFGGLQNNEIDTWQNTLHGPQTLLYRFWFDETGMFPETDSRAHTSEKLYRKLEPFPMDGTVDERGGYLYVVSTTVTLGGKAEFMNKTYCFKILDGGTLQLVSTHPFGGIDLTKSSEVYLGIIPPDAVK